MHMVIEKMSVLLYFLLVSLLCLQQSSAGPSDLSEQCKYEGYAPGGTLPQIGEIVVSPPKFQESMLDNVLGYFGDGAEASQAAVEVMAACAKTMTLAPHVAAAMGAVSVAMGFLVDEPSPEEILKKSHEAVKFLSEEVNIRMDQMKDYVDYRVVDLEKSLMKNRYREFFDRWVQCSQKRSIADEKTCQRKIESDMNSARFHFMPIYNLYEDEDYTPFFDYRYVATWQWMNEYKGSHVSFPEYHDVKKLEAGLIPFRNFASLHMVVLQTLAGTYKEGKDDDSRAHYKYYLEEIIDRGNYYFEYVKWAYEWIYIRQYEENMYFGVKGRAGGGPDSASRGGFLGTTKCQGNKCEVECTQMKADNLCKYTGGLRDASNVCEGYMLALKKDLKKFWKVNLLDVAKRWEAYVLKAKEALSRL